MVMKKNENKVTLLEGFLDSKLSKIGDDERVVGFYLENPNPSIIGKECIYKDTINKYDSDIIYLDGRNGIINLFEIFKVSKDNNITLKRHFYKLEIVYRLLVRNVRDTEVDMFLNIMKLIYIKQGILKNDDEINDEIFEKKYSYPTISFVIDYITKVIDIREEYDKLSQSKKQNFNKAKFLIDNDFESDDFDISLVILKKLSDTKRMSKVKYTLQYIKREYGVVLDGETSIKSSIDKKNVYYELSCLNYMQENVYYIATYNAIYYEMHNCIVNEDKTDYLLFMELRKTLYLNNKEILNQFIEFEKELCLSKTHMLFLIEDIRAYMPNHAFSTIIEKVKEMILSAEYKIIAKQEEAVENTLKKIFSNFTDEEIKKYFIENEKIFLYKDNKTESSFEEMFE